MPWTAGSSRRAADDYERQVTAAVASDPEVKAFVERLETALDEETAENPPEEGELPSADTIASDFQRFLRQRGPGGLDRRRSSRHPSRGHKGLHDDWWIDIPHRAWRDPEIRS